MHIIKGQAFFSAFYSVHAKYHAIECMLSMNINPFKMYNPHISTEMAAFVPP